MKEKLGLAMMFSVCITLFVLLLVLAFPQLFDDGTETVGFAKGIIVALLCYVVGLFAAFKHDKKSTVDKN